MRKASSSVKFGTEAAIVIFLGRPSSKDRGVIRCFECEGFILILEVADAPQSVSDFQQHLGDAKLIRTLRFRSDVSGSMEYPRWIGESASYEGIWKNKTVQRGDDHVNQWPGNNLECIAVVEISSFCSQTLRTAKRATGRYGN